MTFQPGYEFCGVLVSAINGDRLPIPLTTREQPWSSKTKIVRDSHLKENNRIGGKTNNP